MLKRDVDELPQIEQEKSALVLLVPEAEPLVSEFRREFDISASAGLGAHVTSLFPFVLSDDLTHEDLSVLRALCATHPRFNFCLSSVDTFPSVLYLSPTPTAPFEALTRAVAAAFPDCPPYGGKFSNPVPHLTVAQQPAAENLGIAEARLRMRTKEALPLVCAAFEVCLVVKREGQWSVAERFALGDSA